MNRFCGSLRRQLRCGRSTSDLARIMDALRSVDETYMSLLAHTLNGRADCCCTFSKNEEAEKGANPQMLWARHCVKDHLQSIG